MFDHRNKTLQDWLVKTYIGAFEDMRYATPHPASTALSEAAR